MSETYHLSGFSQNDPLSQDYSTDCAAFVSENKSLLESLEKEMCSEDPSFEKFQRTIIGGTFDFFHSGHKMLLSTIGLQTFNGGEVTIGITDNSMLASKSYSRVI